MYSITRVSDISTHRYRMRSSVNPPKCSTRALGHLELFTTRVARGPFNFQSGWRFRFGKHGMADNAASDLVITKATPADPVTNLFSLFAEDEWRISRNFSLSTGLRWDVSPAPKGQNGSNEVNSAPQGQGENLLLGGLLLWMTSQTPKEELLKQVRER